MAGTWPGWYATLAAVRRERKHRVSAPMAVGPNAEPNRGSVGPARPSSLARLIAAAGFLLTSFPLALFWFAALAAPIFLGVFLAAVWVAVMTLAFAPLWWTGRSRRLMLGQGLALISAPLTSLSTRGAQAERRRIAGSLSHPVSTPYRRPPQGSMLDRACARAGDPATWRDLAYLLLLSPVGTFEFVVVIAAFLAVVGTITLPAWLFVAFPEGAPLWREVRIDTLPEAVTVAVVSLPVCVLAAYLLVAGASRAHTALGGALLGPSRSARLAERVEVLTESRSRAMEAAIAERRRIERDLHDGAQQRLVSLAIDLGMAKQNLGEDLGAARELVEEAHGEAKRALSEIRDLVRGIHPAILTDRGLDAALSTLAVRFPVPVVVDVRLDQRLPETIETTAYFVAAEALSNAAKHSGASDASVAVWRKQAPEDRLVVEVTDDGDGGAEQVAGGGLSGLADRLSALDGQLFVQSPGGGPTLVRAEMPLGAVEEEVSEKS
jgi:signal transduction histidine kinase